MIDGLNTLKLTDIAEQAGVILKPSGNRHVGSCPLHGPERTPSFFVFPNNRFKCFGCGASGDPVDFVRKIRGLTFQDALKFLGLDGSTHGGDARARHGEIEDQKRRSALVKRFRTWEVKKADQVTTMIRAINTAAAAWETIQDFNEHGGILDQLSSLDRDFEILLSGSDEYKFELLTKGKAAMEHGDLGRALDGFING